MNITIKEKEITLKKTFRSIIAYESATNKVFNPISLSEIIMYLYCVIIASDTELELSYDEFIDWLDQNENILNEFSQWIVNSNNTEDKLTKKKITAKTKK